MAMSLGKAEINVTPLIDVLLVLIIIFMVVAPQHSVGLPAAVPEPAINTPASPSADIVVSVNKDRSIAINAEPIALERLRDRLLAIFAARASKMIFVRGHRELDFQDVAAIIDVAKEANVFQVALMTE